MPSRIHYHEDILYETPEAFVHIHGAVKAGRAVGHRHPGGYRPHGHEPTDDMLPMTGATSDPTGYKGPGGDFFTGASEDGRL